ncbi:MAG TPA: TlpA disulfide reductase family protein [Xanthobacteraceae bacterium]|nr:TlpA disulfide reductase family protein [Xanthobacteraceae bacterium]
MTADNEAPAARKRHRRPVLAAVSIAVLGLAVYVIAGYARNGAGTDPACTQAAATAKRLAPLARGEVAAVSVADDPHVLPTLTFHDASGAERHLSEWKGRVVLLNLWATWCVPCRKEMPALAALEQKLGGDNFQVVAVNIDTRDPDKPQAWLKNAGVTGLPYYADASARVFQELKSIGKALGMPTSLLVDGSGCEIASLAGPAEWASPDALALVQAALQK